LFLPSITSLGDDLTATVLGNTMLGSVSPDTIEQYTAENRGSSPSIYGLLAGKPEYAVQYWAEEKDDGRTAYYFGSTSGEVAETYRPVQVCKSWMYLTNRVLVPASSGKVSDVEQVSLPDVLPWSTTPSSPSSPSSPVAPSPDPVMVQNATDCVIPSPGAAITSAPSPAATQLTPLVEVASSSSKECDTTFDEAAGDAGLTLLSLVASNVKDALPDPANKNTLFAPTDAAFTGMLGDLGLTIPDALTLGDKLTSVLLYHVHPGEGLSTDELNQRESLVTELDVRLNDVEPYDIGILQGAAGAPPTLVSKRGDVAIITNTITVCDTTVHVIDKVLLPAGTVDDLPVAPPPIPSSETVVDVSQPPQEVSVVQNAVAIGIGPLKSCTVVLEAAGSTLTTLTDDAGTFSFANIPLCATEDGYVRVLRDSQDAECLDAATGLPSAYDYTASLALLGDSMPGDDAPLLVSPLSTLLSSPALLKASMAEDLGFTSDEEMVLGVGTTSNNRQGVDSQALNTALLLGTAISGFDGVDLQTGVEAVNDFIAANLRNKLSLSDPSTAARILNATLVTSSDEAKLDAIGSSTAALNEVLVETWYTDSSSSFEEKRRLTGQVVAFSQQALSPAILALIGGDLSIEDFMAGYGPGAVRSKFPSSAVALPPTSVPFILPATTPAGADEDRVAAPSSGAWNVGMPAVFLPAATVLALFQFW